MHRKKRDGLPRRMTKIILSEFIIHKDKYCSGIDKIFINYNIFYFCPVYPQLSN